MTDNLIKLYLIKSIDNEMQFYGHTTQNLNKILNNYYFTYQKYKQDNINNVYITIYDIFDKYSLDDIEILLMEECKKEDLKERKKFYIINNKYCINKRCSITNENIKKKINNKKKEWRENNIEHVASYNKEYYNKNIDKAREYYYKTKEKVFEKILCECGKLYLHKRKINTIIHFNSRHHTKYINSVNKQLTLTL